MNREQWEENKRHEEKQQAEGELKWALKDHYEAKRAIYKIKTILRGTIDLAAIDTLRTLTTDLIGGIKYEKKYLDGAGPVIDFAVANLPKLETIAREFSSQNAGKHFGVVCSLLFSHLPVGSSSEPSLPIIRGSDCFTSAVKEVISKLPYSLKKKLSDCAFSELEPGKTAGLCGFPNSQLIVIHSQHDDKELKRTIAHEIAHIHFEDHKEPSTPEQEQRAENQARAWGF